MSRDYRKRNGASRPKKSTPPPLWGVFLVGLLVGVFFTGLAWLKLEEPAPKVAVECPKAPPVPETPVAEKRPAVAKPRFDFYTILPEMEVVVSSPDVVTEREAPTPAVVVDAASSSSNVNSNIDTGSSYMVQMGSFHKSVDAERMRANLALIGVEAEIQKVNVNGGDLFHRVRSTPLSRSAANQLRLRLQQQKINSLIVRLRK